MHNSIELAHLFADIMNSHDAGRFAPGRPASGAAMTMRSIDIWRVKNRWFVEHWNELDVLEVFRKIGALPVQGGATR